ncbi:transmembrane protein 180-like [Mytilus edulis]|uniref:transmembrane protein 180-like n=1 Tax=Mytilus edulis TaxID=6550 RepID=UPI0039F00238
MPLSNKTILSYCACVTGFNLIATAYSFYYIKVFMNLYHIEEKWFHGAQILYLIWNAVNDPMFAYIQDSTNFKFTKTRRESIMYSGPLFAISFLLPWIPWGDNSFIVGIHLIVSLFIWDTLFTFVGLAQCTLSTELSTNLSDRITLNRYSSIGSLLGASSVMVLEYTSDSLHNFRAFQTTAVILTICSCTLFWYAGRNAHTEYDVKQLSTTGKEDNDDISHNKTTRESYWRQTIQILSDRNFISFVVANFCQEFHRAFLSSFMAILGDHLISDQDISRSGRKMFYGAVTIMPQLLVIFGTPMIQRYSYFSAIQFSHIYKVGAAIVMLCIGQNHPWCLITFLMLDSCFANASYSLLCLPLSDIADANMMKYNRKHPISSMIFGTNALIVKPAISLSPMLVVTILNNHGYSQLKDINADDVDLKTSRELKHAMFILICFYPIVIGIIQFLSWSRYSVRKRSKQIFIDL